MTTKKHINLQGPSETNYVCICLYGYTYDKTSGSFKTMESIHVSYLDDEGRSILGDHDNNPDCGECLEKYPLALLAITDLE